MRLHPMATLVAAVAFASAAFASPAHSVPLRYRLTLAGLPLGALTLEAEEGGGSYRSRVAFATTGFAGLLDYALEGTADGRVARGHAIVPRLFTARSQSPRALRHTRIEWTNGMPAFVTVDPPRDGTVDAAAAGDALDPASALFRLGLPGRIGDVCDTHFAVYDGSRIVRLDLGVPARSGEDIVCDGLYTRIGGEPLTPIDPPDCPFRLRYAIAPDGTAILQEVRIPTRFGQALIEAAS